MAESAPGDPAGANPIEPGAAYTMALDEARRAALRARLQAQLAPQGGPIALQARAWAVRGRVPGG